MFLNFVHCFLSCCWEEPGFLFYIVLHQLFCTLITSLSLPFSRCRNLHFSLLNFKRLLSAQFSSLLRPLQITAQLSAVSSTHPRFVLYTDLLRVHTVPSSTSLMRMSHSTGPSTKSLWCTTSAWPPWAWLFSQVSYLTSACFQWRFLEAGSYTLHRHLYSWGFFCLQCMHLQNLSLTTESKQCTTTWLCQDVSL